MRFWERELLQLIASFEAKFGHRPTAILAWQEAYSRITSDCRNVVRHRSGPVVYRGIEVLMVDAPGTRIVLDGGKLARDWEE
jgi:hypothetical protein